MFKCWGYGHMLLSCTWLLFIKAEGPLSQNCESNCHQQNTFRKKIWFPDINSRLSILNKLKKRKHKQFSTSIYNIMKCVSTCLESKLCPVFWRPLTGKKINPCITKMHTQKSPHIREVQCTLPYRPLVYKCYNSEKIDRIVFL